LAAILKIVDISKILKTQNCSFNGDLSLHRQFSTGLHFQNCRYNTAKIQHCTVNIYLICYLLLSAIFYLYEHMSPFCIVVTADIIMNVYLLLPLEGP
jgi:hypothetical protein